MCFAEAAKTYRSIRFYYMWVHMSVDGMSDLVALICYLVPPLCQRGY